jgi:SecY interacting protein Syd
MGEVARRLLALLQRASVLPVEYDPEWPSPCAVLPPDVDNMVRWRPVTMEPPADFVDIPLHPDVREFYTSFWSGSAGGRHSGEAVLIRVAWNADELARIRQSLAAQVAVAEPIFVANTDSDWYFAVDNATGAVLLCEPGRPPIREVAPSLSAFLASVE